MKYLYSRTVWAAAILMVFIGGASVAGTWVCSDPQGNEVYTDRNGPRCKEFQPTNPDDAPKQPTVVTPQASKRRASDAIPFSLPPSGERKSGAVTELDHKGTNYSEPDLLRAVASGNKAK